MGNMDFKDVSNIRSIYLTTIGRKTGKPHTVEVWFSYERGNVYLSHEGKYTDWMKNIIKDGSIELKINNKKFKGIARIVQDEMTFDKAKNSLYLKYYGQADREVVDDWFSESTIIEVMLI